MTLLLLRRYLVELRLVMTAVMVSALFAAMGDMGIVMAFAATLGGLVVLPSRASLYETALPIDAKAIVRARLLASLVCASVPLAAWFVGLHFYRNAKMSAFLFTDMFGIRAPTNLDRASLCAVIVTAAALPLAIRPRELKMPPKVLVTGAFVALLVATALLFRFVAQPVTFVLLSAGAIGVVGWILIKAPSSFQLSSLAIEESDSKTQTATQSKSSGRWWLVAIARSLIAPHWGFFTILLAVQAATGQWALMLGIQFGYVILLRQKSAWMAALPLSRRQLMMLTFAPVMLSTFGAIVVGSFAPIPWFERFQHMNPVSWQSVSNPYAKGKFFDSKTNVKLMFWEIAPNGKPPVIKSPNGETIEPYTLHILGMTLYNPYSSNEQSSKEFVAWQYARASTRVYGHAVPLPKSFEAGLVFPPPVYESMRIRILSVGFLLSFLMTLYCLGGLARLRAPNGKRLWHRAGNLAPIIFVLIMIGADFAAGLGAASAGVVVQFVKRLLLDLSLALPSNIFAVLLAATLPVVALYALVEWQFRYSELVPLPIAKPA